ICLIVDRARSAGSTAASTTSGTRIPPSLPLVRPLRSFYPVPQLQLPLLVLVHPLFPVPVPCPSPFPPLNLGPPPYFSGVALPATSCLYPFPPPEFVPLALVVPFIRGSSL